MTQTHTSDDAQEPRAFGPARPDRPSATYLMDWIGMLPIPDASYRIYVAVRQFVHEKDGDYVVDLTNEEIGRLTPQANGQPRHPRSVSRAMEWLFEWGLFELVEDRRISVTVPGQRRPEIRTVRTIAVRDEPREGFTNFTGAVNPFQERKRIAQRREQERRERVATANADVTPDRPTPASRAPSDETNLSRQADQEQQDDATEGDHVFPGHSEWTNLGPVRDKSVPAVDKSVHHRNQHAEPSTDNHPGGPAPLDPPDGEDSPLRSESSPMRKPDHSDQVVPTQQDVCSNHRHARARAGPTAVRAIQDNPDITKPELEQIISRSNPRLTHGQVVGRAVRLLAFEHRARRSQPTTVTTDPVPEGCTDHTDTNSRTGGYHHPGDDTGDLSDEQDDDGQQSSETGAESGNAVTSASGRCRPGGRQPGDGGTADGNAASPG